MLPAYETNEQALPEVTHFKGDYRFLSNFQPVEVTLDGLTYPSTEHAYQAAKTRSSILRNFIRTCDTPGGAKKAGRSIVLRPDWEEVKVDVMRELLAQKFANDPLKGQLLALKGRYLREGNTWGDRIWGCTWNPGLEAWEGDNLLGRLLMELRDKLLAVESEASHAG